MPQADNGRIFTYCKEVRVSGLSVCVPFRCDAPKRRRFMELEIAPLKNKQIKFSSRILRQESRDPVNWLEESEDCSEELIRMCSWCKKIHTAADRWLEIEDAIRELRLFNVAKPPGITHGFCPACYQAFVQKLA